jgi:DNA-binding SARP family transcriptional activator
LSTKGRSRSRALDKLAQLGQLEDAAQELAGLAEHFSTHNSLIELTQVLGLQAHAALLSGDATTAGQTLVQAISVGRNRRSLQTLIAEIGHAPALEALVTTHPDRFEPLMRGLKQLRDAQPKEPVSASSGRGESGKYTYSLRILTLGQESIERDGEHIPVAEWRATTAREVFLYLLFNGRQSRERISLVFWPENSTRRVRSNFHTTLYRIRQALGENVITFQDGLYLVNPDLDVRCDATQFEQLAVQARLLSPRDARTEDMWRRARELYQGEFLPSLDAEWVVPRRESLQEVYIEALIGLGKCMRARHDVKGALEAFRQALEVDPYQEDAHRSIMNCYADLGEKKRILDHLQGLQIRLRRDLAIEPSEETLTLAASLLT